MAGRFGAELVRVILVPEKTLEDAFFEDRPGFAFQPGQVALEGKGFQPVRIVEQGEVFRKDLFTDLVFRQEGKTALQRAAVEADPVHEIKHLGDGGRAEDDIVAAQRDLLRGIALVVPHQEGQVPVAGGPGPGRPSSGRIARRSLPI